MNQSFVIVCLVCFIILLLYLLVKSNTATVEVKSAKQSLSTRYGQISEQFMPFMGSYPFDSKQFKFLGNPIDGVQFEDDKIIFVEFKVNTSSLSQKQRNIRDLIKENKVFFKEIKIR